MTDTPPFPNANLDHAAQGLLPDHKIITPPQLVTARGSSSYIYLDYDERLNTNLAHTPSVSQYSITVGSNSPFSPSTLEVRDSTVRLTLGTALTSGQTVTLSYTVPNDLTALSENSGGGRAAALADQPITNNTGDANNLATGDLAVSGTPRSGSTLTVNMSAISDADGLGAFFSGFSYQWIQVDSGSTTEIPSATQTTYTLTSDDVGKQVKVQVSFTDDYGNSEQITSGDYPETGTIENPSPILNTSGVAVFEDTLLLPYDIALDQNSTPATSDFTVSVGNVSVALVHVRVLSTEVQLTLTEAVTHSQSMTLSYTAGTSPIQSVNSALAENIVDQAVSNNTPDSTTLCTSSGDGSSLVHPIIICDYSRLKAIANDVESVDDGFGGTISFLRKHYALGADIDAALSWSEGEANCGAYNGTDIATTNPCTGWVPLPEFSGSFNGRGHAISNLYIYSSKDTVGFFSQLGKDQGTGGVSIFAFIKDLQFRQARVEGTSSTDSTNVSIGVGVLSGATGGTGVVVDGVSVLESQIKGKTAVGALTGNSGPKSSTISNSYVDDILAEGLFVGGIMGSSGGSVLITNTYARGVVENPSTGTGIKTAGGLVGNIGVSLKIQYSFADVEVKGKGRAGSLTGHLGEVGSINNSYGVGSVTSTGTAGGFVGFIGVDPPSSSANNFWDTESTGQANSATHANLTSTGLTTVEIQSDCAGTNSSDDICSLGSAFVFSAGSYPKLKKCTTCTTTPVFSSDLVGGQ